MATVEGDLQSTLVGNRELWIDGPPHALFKRLRNECPVHWSTRIEEFPEEAGYWSVTTADDIHTVSRDWQTYSSEKGGVTERRPSFRWSSRRRCSSAWIRPSTTV